MRDWNSFVRARLRIRGLERQQEIIRELADYLGDAERDGNQELQVCDWAQFSQEIRRAEEGNMATRLRSLWLPGLMTGVLSVLLLRVVQYSGVHPFIVRVWDLPLVFYAQWLVLLPLVGAAGALVCGRAGGRGWARLTAAVFSSAALLVFFSLTWLCVAVVTVFRGEGIAQLGMLCATFATVIGVWILLPGAALAVGAFPFLWTQRTAKPGEPRPARA